VNTDEVLDDPESALVIFKRRVTEYLTSAGINDAAASETALGTTWERTRGRVARYVAVKCAIQDLEGASFPRKGQLFSGSDLANSGTGPLYPKTMRPPIDCRRSRKGAVRERPMEHASTV
jgi:hypothetical protein